MLKLLGVDKEVRMVFMKVSIRIACNLSTTHSAILYSLEREREREGLVHLHVQKYIVKFS